MHGEAAFSRVLAHCGQAHRARTTALAAIGVAALILSACGGGGGSSSSGSATTAPATGAAPKSAPASGATGGSPVAAAGKPYIIGVHTTLTGPVPVASALGRSCLGGMKAYVEALNKRGGVGGRPVQLEAMDDHFDLPTGLSNYKELVSKGALGVFCWIGSNIWASAGPQAEKEKVAQIGTAGVDDFTTSPKPYLYRPNFNNHLNIGVQFTYLQQLAKASGQTAPKIALVTLNTASGAVSPPLVKAAAEKLKWSVVDVQVKDPAATDVSAQAASIAGNKPDYVLVEDGGDGQVLVVQALRQRGVTVPIIGAWFGADEAVLQRIADDNFYVVRDFVWPTDPDVPAAATMRQDAQAADQTKEMIASYFTVGYVSGLLIEETLKKCGPDCDAVKFNTTLEQVNAIDSKGLSGPLGFSATNHELALSGRIYKWDKDKKRSVAVTDWLNGAG